MRTVENHGCMKKSFVENNPYRILGVYTGHSLANEIKNKNQIIAFAKVGQKVKYSLRGDDKLSQLDRTEVVAEDAFLRLSVQEDRIRHAFFWYADRKYAWGELVNRAVDHWIDGRISEALLCYDFLLSDNDLCGRFASDVASGMCSRSNAQIREIFLESLSAVLEYDDIVPFCLNCDENGCLGELIFNKFVRAELDRLTDSFMKNPSNINQLLDDFYEISSKIVSCTRLAGRIYGLQGMEYKAIAETVVKALYAQGQYVLDYIAFWGTSGRCSESIKICISFIKSLTKYIDKEITSLKIDDYLYSILGNNYDRTVATVENKCKNLLKKAIRQEIVGTSLWIICLICLTFSIVG